MKQVSTSQRQWITKRAARECGANAVLFRRKAKDTDLCPLCNQTETVLHVLRCQDPRSQLQWDTSVQEFRLWLEHHQTDPLIINRLCAGLNQWRDQGQVLMESANDDLTRQQNSVGWNGVLEGCFHRGWECVQQRYFN